MARALFSLIFNAIAYNPHHMHSAFKIRQIVATWCAASLGDQNFGIALHDQTRSNYFKVINVLIERAKLGFARSIKTLFVLLRVGPSFLKGDVWFGMSLLPFLSGSQPIRFAVHLQDTNVMGESVKQRPDQPLRTKDTGPLIKW